MLTFINNVKVKGPYDYELRHLNENEIYLITPLFYRKSKKTFDFKEVAEKIAGFFQPPAPVVLLAGRTRKKYDFCANSLLTFLWFVL